MHALLGIGDQRKFRGTLVAQPEQLYFVCGPTVSRNSDCGLELFLKVEELAGMKKSKGSGTLRIGALGEHPMHHRLSAIIVMRGLPWR